MKTKTVPIKACAEVLPGFSIKTAVVHDPNGTHQIILAKHLPDSGPYKYKPEHEIRMTPERPAERYLVSPGDLIFMSRGSFNRAVLLESIPDSSLASASFYILKLKKGVAPGYIAWCLNQDSVQIKVAEIRTGAGTPLVPRADFAQIPIVLPSLETQRKISEISSLMAHEKMLANRMRQEIERKHRLLGQKIIRSLRRESLVRD